MAYVDLEQLTDHVNHKLALGSEWCTFDKLPLKPEKSEFLLETNLRFNFIRVIHV